MYSDTIADMLSRIKNGYGAAKEIVEIPFSNVKRQIARIMTEENFLRGYEVLELPENKRVIRVYLKYTDDSEPVLKKLKRYSKPGRRRYVSADEIPEIRNGLGIAILTTSKGVLTDQQARMLGVGGEVMCYMW